VGSASRETRAAAIALGAYLTTVLPAARRELKRWGPLPAEKVRNTEAVAVFATLAPRAQRTTAVRAIVALQVAIDLRDTLEESAELPVGGDLLDRLEAEWRLEAAALASGEALLPLIERAVERCAEGQRRTHAAALGEVEELRHWAESLESPTEYRWFEVAAGASSSVAAHALIAAAADPRTTAETAASIDAAYYPPIGALTVLLDDLVDRDEDLANGEHNYLRYYAGSEEAAGRLAVIAGRAERLLGRLPNSRRHQAILAGVAGFYLSSAEAETPYASPIRTRLLAALGPGARLLTAFMRIRRLGERKRPEQAGSSPGP
jgi:Protein of unknown function (DUF2600)